MISEADNSKKLEKEWMQDGPKYKVGDKVNLGVEGVSKHSDTGTVQSIDSYGNHTVVHDNYKEYHDDKTPVVSRFTKAGRGMGGRAALLMIKSKVKSK